MGNAEGRPQHLEEASSQISGAVTRSACFVVSVGTAHHSDALQTTLEMVRAHVETTSGGIPCQVASPSQMQAFFSELKQQHPPPHPRRQLQQTIVVFCNCPAAALQAQLQRWPAAPHVFKIALNIAAVPRDRGVDDDDVDSAAPPLSLESTVALLRCGINMFADSLEGLSAVFPALRAQVAAQSRGEGEGEGEGETEGGGGGGGGEGGGTESASAPRVVDDCPVCGFADLSASQLQRHVSLYHGNAENSDVDCPLCVRQGVLDFRGETNFRWVLSTMQYFFPSSLALPGVWHIVLLFQCKQSSSECKRHRRHRNNKYRRGKFNLHMHNCHGSEVRTPSKRERERILHRRSDANAHLCIACTPFTPCSLRCTPVTSLTFAVRARG